MEWISQHETWKEVEVPVGGQNRYRVYNELIWMNQVKRRETKTGIFINEKPPNRFHVQRGIKLQTNSIAIQRNRFIEKVNKKFMIYVSESYNNFLSRVNDLRTCIHQFWQHSNTKYLHLHSPLSLSDSSSVHDNGFYIAA